MNLGKTRTRNGFAVAATYVHHTDFGCDVIDLSVYAQAFERAEQTRCSRFARSLVGVESRLSTARSRLRPRLSVSLWVINDVRAKWEERKRTRLPEGRIIKGPLPSLLHLPQLFQLSALSPRPSPAAGLE